MVKRGKVIVICEVKTRSSDRYGEPVEAVTPAKVRRLRRLAGEWLSEARANGELAGGAMDVRFDVAAVTVKDGETIVEVLEGVC